MGRYDHKGRLYSKGALRCRYGHVKEGRNLYVDPSGHKICRTCRNLLNVEYYWRNRIQTMGQLEQFTGRERDVWRLVSLGLDDVEIAKILKLSPKTINVHISNLYQKLGLTGSTTLSKRVVLSKLYKEPHATP